MGRRLDARGMPAARIGTVALVAVALSAAAGGQRALGLATSGTMAFTSESEARSRAVEVSTGIGASPRSTRAVRIHADSAL